jgi:(1->4)-alpha-D-glucan 1-alpha-D-glucosylmutase
LKAAVSRYLTEGTGAFAGPAIARLQQLSATIAAKGTEDTAFYRHGALLSRNEVGAGPAVTAISTDDLHSRAYQRARSHPGAMLSSATHDTKRGEDSRARLAVLTECPRAWAACVRSWLTSDPGAPHPADQLMLFQSLVGSWPMDAATPVTTQYVDRIAEWQRKSLREGKLRSSWATPDEAHEKRCDSFLRQLIADKSAEIGSFVERISAVGVVNSLAQLVLKLTLPGVPDFYQGSDLWDLALVDPDNRKPVDFRVRARSLREGADPVQRLTAWRTGHVKQALIARILAFRRRNADLFDRGGYVPLTPVGALARHVIAFRRQHQGQQMVVVATRHAGKYVLGQKMPLVPPPMWADTSLDVANAAGLEDILAGAAIPSTDGKLAVSDALRSMPVALLRSK